MLYTLEGSPVFKATTDRALRLKMLLSGSLRRQVLRKSTLTALAVRALTVV